MSKAILNSGFFSANRTRFSSRLKENEFALFLSSDMMPRNGDQFFPFRQNSNLFYLSGIKQEHTSLFIAPGHPDPAMREVLFIRSFDEKMVIWEGKKLEINEAVNISGVKTVFFSDRFDEVLADFARSFESVCLDGDLEDEKQSLPGEPFYRMHQRLKDEHPSLKQISCKDQMNKLRLIKSREEIDTIKEAISITLEAFVEVLRKCKAGMMEYEMEALLGYAMRKRGADDHAFHPILASGANACYLHYVFNNQQMEEGEMLLMDFGAELNNYAADISRTIPVNGRFTDRQKEVYNAVLRVQEKTKSYYKPGKTINDINEACLRFMEEELIALGLIKQADFDGAEESPVKKYFMHGTAHFIGLDVHDVGSKETNLEPGMILSCEPGIYIPEEKLGVRLENDILITENEPLDLCADVPVEIEDIERLMNNN